MPLIDTSLEKNQGIEEILQNAGLKSKPANSLAEKLKNARLDTQTLLEGVSEIASNGDTDAIRLRAIETGLKLNPETRAALNDESGKQVPVFNIIIKDATSVNVGQILLPRLTTNKVIDIETRETNT